MNETSTDECCTSSKSAFTPIKKFKIKIVPECIKLELFGDVMKFSKKNPRDPFAFNKYDALAVSLISDDKHKRVMLYKFICALGLSAHARRTNSKKIRKELFEIKNNLFFSIANDIEKRRVLNFCFCVSTRFKVMNYCANCAKKNQMENLPQRDWTFCNDCEVDRAYFNVLSMFHKHKAGGASMFLGKDLIPKVVGLKAVKHVKLDEFPERFTFGNYHYTPHNLITLDLKSVIDCSLKLLILSKKNEAESMSSLVARSSANTSADVSSSSNSNVRKPYRYQNRPVSPG